MCAFTAVLVAKAPVVASRMTTRLSQPESRCGKVTVPVTVAPSSRTASMPVTSVAVPRTTVAPLAWLVALFHHSATRLSYAEKLIL